MFFKKTPPTTPAAAASDEEAPSEELYKILATQRRSWVAVVLSWIVACALGLTPLLGWHKPKQATAKNQTHTVYKFIDVIDMSYMVYFNFFGCILVPLLAMLLLYVHLFQDIRRHLRENMAGGKENSTYYLKERKLAQSLALVLMLFAICWLPLHVMNSLLHIQNVDIPTIAFHAGILLSHANSAVNPIVYAFKIHKFKRAYLLIWRRYVLCRKEDTFETDRSADNFASSIPRTLAMVTE
ncbi:hypothetical protein JZ751_003425 [Albula glossodonta]|uniref:G-protein coupled receptors family 1 profile domain-containing protein n=1 Tax=Albula glossodonta TaxID=121402 RepID=A0A8T2N7N6_9TELE|nr:hypothetical protein JZ751_003425 [Albula glossodonta]